MVKKAAAMGPHPTLPHAAHGGGLSHQPALTRRALLTGTAALAATLATTGPRASFAAIPAPRPNGGRKWRIGYAESMPFGNYVATLHGVALALGRMGWLSGVAGAPYSPSQWDSAGLWRWLAERDLGPHVEFVADAYYPRLDRNAPDEALNRLATARDIDLMIVMGTIAGTKLATDTHAVPTLVFSSTNPVAAKIVASESDPGREHVWAHLDLTRFHRQLHIFHDTFRFQRLGVAYDDSTVGRAIASLSDIEAMAGRLGFALVRRHVTPPADEADFPRYYADLGRAWAELSGEVDAMYITYGRWELDRFRPLVQPFLDRRIPTFSQLGPEEVERGALMSVARADFAGIGQFGAGTIARLFGGERLRSLPQVYFDTPTIAWNIATAETIGHRIPFDALLAADTVFGGT